MAHTQGLVHQLSFRGSGWQSDDEPDATGYRTATDVVAITPLCTPVAVTVGPVVEAGAVKTAVTVPSMTSTR